MKLFECHSCGQPLYFENARCPSCDRRLGYIAAAETLSPLEPAPHGAWRALSAPQGLHRPCANAEHGVCNWLVDAGGSQMFCVACRHNRTIPDLSTHGNLAHWRKIEIAKHRLFYTLLKVGLPVATRAEDPNGLVFDFVADPSDWSRVLTGHDDGLITINLAEADDAKRERQRHAMGEPYRTLLGHFRHEIAHYYWQRIADAGSIEEFRALFGDERQEYGVALNRHYAHGAPDDWHERHVTGYASAHPWEDFAETFAHYLHMVDTLETVGGFGLRIGPKVAADGLATKVDFDPHTADLDRLVKAWLPLTFALNAISRSMGMPDMYPFVLAPTVMFKLAFIHWRIRALSGRPVKGRPGQGLRAAAAVLNTRIGVIETP
jgi:hypothetical protein